MKLSAWTTSVSSTKGGPLGSEGKRETNLLLPKQKERKDFQASETVNF